MYPTKAYFVTCSGQIQRGASTHMATTTVV